MPRIDSKSEQLLAFLLKIRELGVYEHKLLSAFEAVDRQAFVEVGDNEIWEDRSFDIGTGQISTSPVQIAQIASMLELNASSKILEIGIGSGYQMAILSRLCRRIYGVDRIRSLVKSAEKRLLKQGVRNVTLMAANGFEGWTVQAPFDAIVINGATESIPPKLLEQLKPNGKIICTLIKDDSDDETLLFEFDGGELKSKLIGKREVPVLIDNPVVD